jgi:RNA polymerase sigma factor (TIGR02999 family)
MSEQSQSRTDRSNGQASTADQLLPLVYEELRRLAASRMAREPAGHTLQPTALVHEAWLRLVKDDSAKFANRGHFFGAAAEAMRRILIERARRKQAMRHGGGLERVDLDEIQVPLAQTDDQLLAINEALDKLAAETPVEAEVVKLRYFVGMTNAETAEALALSERTVNYYWAHARAWLYHEITSGQDGIRNPS